MENFLHNIPKKKRLQHYFFWQKVVAKNGLTESFRTRQK